MYVQEYYEMERGGLPEYYEMFVQVYNYDMERGSLKGKGKMGSYATRLYNSIWNNAISKP